jgi:ATP-dependent exoDNAse (exonuclease V) alpha subunit
MKCKLEEICHLKNKKTPAIPPLDIGQRKWKQQRGHFYSHVYCSTIHKSQGMA